MKKDFVLTDIRVMHHIYGQTLYAIISQIEHRTKHELDGNGFAVRALSGHSAYESGSSKLIKINGILLNITSTVLISQNELSI